MFALEKPPEETAGSQYNKIEKYIRELAIGFIKEPVKYHEWLPLVEQQNLFNLLENKAAWIKGGAHSYKPKPDDVVVRIGSGNDDPWLNLECEEMEKIDVQISRKEDTVFFSSDKHLFIFRTEYFGNLDGYVDMECRRLNESSNDQIKNIANSVRSRLRLARTRKKQMDLIQELRSIE
ncbi:hypothetical protein GF340_04820 [Candidatus Peregrinibacteria bacterium]|nr:hypothetical protein [Candidatus Peregrinibacteria bacterium]